jgi:hypothetical protein
MNDQARDAVFGWQRTVNAAWQQPAGLLSPTSVRKLTPEEVALVHSVFGDSIDTSQIEVAVGGPLGVGGYARTLPNLITFPEGTVTTPSPDFNKWLAHEMTHIWQYQHGYNTAELLPDAIVHDTDYGGPQGLRDAAAQGKHFTQFGFEEQAAIVADYYDLSRTGADTSAYLPFVTSARNGEVVRPSVPPLVFPDYPSLPIPPR